MRLILLLQIKCFQYWPENHEEEMVFGDISVVLQSTDVWADYAIRTLRVIKVTPHHVMLLNPHIIYCKIEV